MNCDIYNLVLNFGFDKIPPLQGMLDGVERSRKDFNKRFNKEMNIWDRKDRFIKFLMG